MGSGSVRRSKKQVTIADLASHLNISKATVSLALNDSPLVADATKERVREAARQFGYRPNYFGARLSRGKSDMIGLYILGGTAQECNWTRPSSWMFYHPLLKAVSTELSSHGYRFNLEVVSVEQAVEEGMIASVIQEGSLDGMLLVVQDAIDYSFLQVVEEHDFPFVVLNAKVSEKLSSVSINNELGAAKAVHHLVSLGHTRIAHLGGPRKDTNAIERREGFIQALQTMGLEVDPALIRYGDWQRSGGWEAAQAFLELDNPPTAVFCANDHMAIGLIQGLQQKGVQVPGDISVLGFDDTEICEIVVPNLTTVHQPVDQMGELGAKEVLRQIEEETSSPTHICLEPELIIRDSTAGLRKLKS